MARTLARMARMETRMTRWLSCVWRVCIVTSGIRLVVDFSLIFRHYSCANSSTFSIFLRTFCWSYPQATKVSEYSIIRFSNIWFDEHILRSLSAWLYGILCFRCGGCGNVEWRYGCVSVGFWYTSVMIFPSWTVTMCPRNSRSMLIFRVWTWWM